MIEFKDLFLIDNLLSPMLVSLISVSRVDVRAFGAGETYHETNARCLGSRSKCFVVRGKKTPVCCPCDRRRLHRIDKGKNPSESPQLSFQGKQNSGQLRKKVMSLIIRLRLTRDRLRERWSWKVYRLFLLFLLPHSLRLSYFNSR